MEKDVEELVKALKSNLELVRLLSNRIELLEQASMESATERFAGMLMLRAIYLCLPNQEEVAALVERTAAQMQIQPGVLLGNQDNFRLVKQHLDWMTAPPPAQ